MNKQILRIKGTILIITAIILLSYSCSTTKSSNDSKDLSYIYNPIKNTINPRYGVFNQSENESILSIKFFKNDLYFNEANPRGIPMAQIHVSVQLYNLSHGKSLQDTIVYNLDIVKEESREEYLYHLPMKVEQGTDYVADIRIMDRIKLNMTHAFVPFNTRSDANRYNFYARGHFLHNELLNPVVRRNEYLDLIYSRRPIDSLFISYYKPYQGVPYAPNMILPERTLSNYPDTTIALKYSDTIAIMLPNKGVYLCKTERKSNEGYTLFNFGSSFPSMTTPEEMIEPLEYIASADEISALRANPKPKVALDNFWVGCGGNIEKSRELIRIYYMRALYANFYFTSYKEGWRSDRGMIYIVYGPPDKMYKTSGEENWGYRRAQVKSSWGTRYRVSQDYVFFNFKKLESKFSDNDYYLSRSETIVTYWGKAVSSWRKGVVFRLDNPGNY